MKTIKSIILSIVALTVSNFAFAGAYDDVATITSVTPLQGEQMVQQQVCPQTVSQAAPVQERSVTGSLLGGITGALLGSNVGNGNGRTVAIAAGAIAGAVTGDRLDNRAPVQQASCYLVAKSELRVVGYQVSFDYNGRNYKQTMQFDPSQGGNTTLRVNVNVVAR